MTNTIDLAKLLLKYKTSMLVLSVNSSVVNSEHDNTGYQQRRATMIKQDPVARVISSLNKSPEYRKLKTTFTNFLVQRGDTSIYGETMIQLFQELKNVVTSTAGGAELMPRTGVTWIERMKFTIIFRRKGVNPHAKTMR